MMVIEINLQQATSSVVSTFTGTNGLYSSVRPSRSAGFEIKMLVQENLNLHTVPDLHCTIMYSKKAIDPKEAFNYSSRDYRALPKKITWWEGHDKVGYLVLLLDSAAMQNEHNRLRRAGCEPTFDEYVPHVTLISPFAKNLLKSYEYDIKNANLYIRRNADHLMFGNQTNDNLKMD